MELSELGVVLQFLIVCYSLFIPIWVFRNVRPTVQPFRLRLHAVRWTAVLAVLPIPSILLWDSVGMPATLSPWPAFCLFFLALATSLLPVALESSFLNARALVVILLFSSCGLFVAVQLCAPLLWTLVAVYSQPTEVHPDPFALNECQDVNERPVLAHISDLHISEFRRTRDGKAPGNEKLVPLLDAINKHNPRFLIISGDLTDMGTPEEWNLLNGLRSRLNPSTKIFIATGNHDLNHFFGADPVENPWTWFGFRTAPGLSAEPRIFRAAEFQSLALPEVRTFQKKTLGEITRDRPNSTNLSHFKEQESECVNSCIADTGPDPADVKLQAPACRGRCANNLESITYFYYNDFSRSFPLLYVDQTSRTAFISITTSTGESKSVGRNAIASSGRLQIAQLKQELAELPSDVRDIVIVEHHPPFWSGVPSFPHYTPHDLLPWNGPIDKLYTSQWFLAVFLHNDFLEEKEIYDIVAHEIEKRAGASVIFAYGHRHERSIGRVGRMIFEEAPNLATPTPDDFGFYLVGSKGDSLQIAWCKVAQR